MGALLEARSVHPPGRSAYHHLLALAQTHGIPRRRVDEVIELVGLQWTGLGVLAAYAAAALATAAIQLRRRDA